MSFLYPGVVDPNRVQQLEARRQLTIQRFVSIVHDGWRASLPGEAGLAFEPVMAESPQGAYDIANSSGDELRPSQRTICIGTVNKATQFMGRILTKDLPFDQTQVMAGKQEIYRGWLHGRFGKGLGTYELGQYASHDETHPYNRVLSRYDAYSAVPPQLQVIDENILCMFAMAYTAPSVFPWVKDQYWQTDPAQVPHINEYAERGRVALERVVAITGKTTDLQAALIH